MKLRNLILIGLVALYLIGTVSAQISEGGEEEKIYVAVTIPPLVEFVEQIGGDKVVCSALTSKPHSTPEEGLTYFEGVIPEEGLNWKRTVLGNEYRKYAYNNSDKQIAFVLVGSGIEFEDQFADCAKNIMVELVIVPLLNETKVPVFVVNCSNGIELINDDSKLSGVLISAYDNSIGIKTDTGDLDISLDDIKQGKIVF